MHHGDDDVCGARYEVHGPAHSLYELARNFPVGDVAVFGDFHCAEYRQINVLAPDHGEAGHRIEDRRAGQGGDRLLARIDQVGVFFPFVGKRPHPENAIFGLKGDFQAVGNVVGNEGRNADAEVDVPAVLKFGGDALGDLLFAAHGGRI